MYIVSLFKVTPGPWYFKLLLFLTVFVFICYGLFEYVFPYLQETYGIIENTVDDPNYTPEPTVEPSDTATTPVEQNPLEELSQNN